MPKRPAPRIARSQLVACIAAAGLATVAPRIYAQVRIAVVDIQRALVETAQGQRANGQIKALYQKRQVELDGRQDALKHVREDLEKQKSTLDQATLQARMQDYLKQLSDLEQTSLEYQRELAAREADLTKQIYTNLQAVVRQIGQQDAYTAIFEQSGVVWSPQHLDLTDRVVQQYNQAHPASEPLNPVPAAPAAPAAPAPGGTAAPAPARTPANPHPRGEATAP